ncbi:MAG: DNA-binding protein [Planctomycetaceae bacterium]
MARRRGRPRRPRDGDGHEPAQRLILDANILFSAAKSDGAIRALVTRLLHAGHDCQVDGYVIEEARRNIVAKAPGHLPQLEALLPRLRISPVVPARARIDLPGLPEKDRLVLAAAAALGCDALVTGDRTHFGRSFGRTVAGVRIHSPRSLYDDLFSGS